LALLRGSGKHNGIDYHFEGIVDGSGGSGVAHERELLAFADAAIDPSQMAAEQGAALAACAGREAMRDAAAVIAGFDAITRVADATGIPLEAPKAEASVEWRDRLGIDEFWRMKV